MWDLSLSLEGNMSTVLQSFLSYDLNPDLYSLGHIVMVLDVKILLLGLHI